MSACGYKRTLSESADYVRFPPLGGREKRTPGMTASDPKQPLAGLRKVGDFRIHALDALPPTWRNL